MQTVKFLRSVLRLCSPAFPADLLDSRLCWLCNSSSSSSSVLFVDSGSLSLCLSLSLALALFPTCCADIQELPDFEIERLLGRGDMGADEYIVEALLDTKLKQGKRMYLVRWEGYPPSCDTWEPAENFTGAHCKHLIQELSARVRDKQANKRKREPAAQGASNPEAALPGSAVSPTGR